MTSWARSVVAWVLHPKIHARPLSCSSGCQSWYSATTRCSFLSHFYWRRSGPLATVDILFLALGPYTPEGIKMASRGFCESYTHSGVPIRLGQVVVNVCTRFEVSGINSFEDIKGVRHFKCKSRDSGHVLFRDKCQFSDQYWPDQ